VAASSSASQRAFSVDLRAQRVVEPGIVKVGIAFTTARLPSITPATKPSSKFADGYEAFQLCALSSWRDPRA
jgi:hypothetical protein